MLAGAVPHLACAAHLRGMCIASRNQTENQRLRAQAVVGDPEATGEVEAMGMGEEATAEADAPPVAHAQLVEASCEIARVDVGMSC